MITVQDDLDISNYTLVLPSVAVGNVGQLTIDLLISTLGLKKVGHLFNSSFIPIVGANPYDDSESDICTSVDLYVGHDVKLVALQIRSPLVKRPTEFFRQLHRFLYDRKISKVSFLVYN